MEIESKIREVSLSDLGEFFNSQHDKLLCTSNTKGEPNIALMMTPKLLESGEIEMGIKYESSRTLQNIRENRTIVFMTYIPDKDVLAYTGVRVYANVTKIFVRGENTDEFCATVTCRITSVRPLVDRGQVWIKKPC